MGILEALKHIQDAASSPYAILAYITVVGAWLYISAIRHRLHNIAKVLKDLPEKDRAKIILKEYNTIPKQGLSAEQWIRARDRILILIGFIATLIALLIAFLSIYANFNKTYAYYNHSKFESLEKPIKDRTEKYSQQDTSQMPQSTSKLQVISILEGNSKNKSSRVFDITLANNDEKEVFLKKFLSRWRYNPGTTAIIAEGAVFNPLAEYVLDFSIDVLDDSWRTRDDPIYPLLMLPAKNSSGPGIGTFRLQLHYSLEQGYHPSANWDIEFDIEIVDNRKRRLPVFHGATWRER